MLIRSILACSALPLNRLLEEGLKERSQSCKPPSPMARIAALPGNTDVSEDALSVEIGRSVTAALTEDIGTGDISAELIDPDSAASATVITRQDGVFCGLDWADEVLKQVDPAMQSLWYVADGDHIRAGQKLLDLNGPARSLLTAERNLLNFVQLLSGTATLTARYVETIAEYPTTILDTRKTIPGLRLAQKYAVRCGGARNHRLGLYDAFLIKENHIASVGSIAAAVTKARLIASRRPQRTLVEIEVETEPQLLEALAAEADIIMLDNFDVPALTRAVARTAGRAKLEASGGITLSNLRAIAATGVDYISVGEITKQVIPLDLSMRFA
jgi:nicotinate-nucleotide pyrophosphorylase (carboxylating)